MTARRKRNFVKVGSIKIPWRKFGDGRTCIDLHSLGQGRKTFVDHAEAIAEAERIARERHNGGAELMAFNANDRAVYAQLCEASRIFSVAPQDAVVEWREARRNAVGHSLGEVVRAGVAVLAKPIHRTIDIAREMLASKDAHDLNKRYRRGLTTDLLGADEQLTTALEPGRAFAQVFPGDLAAITAVQIEAWRNAIPHGAAKEHRTLECAPALFLRETAQLLSGR